MTNSSGESTSVHPQARFRGDLASMPDNHRRLHWSQVKVYGALLCRERALDEVRLALVYLDVVSQRETLIEERFDAATLEAFFEDQCRRFLAWAEQEQILVGQIDVGKNDGGAPIEHLQFPGLQRNAAEQRALQVKTTIRHIEMALPRLAFFESHPLPTAQNFATRSTPAGGSSLDEIALRTHFPSQRQIQI